MYTINFLLFVEIQLNIQNTKNVFKYKSNTTNTIVFDPTLVAKAVHTIFFSIFVSYRSTFQGCFMP